MSILVHMNIETDLLTHMLIIHDYKNMKFSHLFNSLRDIYTDKYGDFDEFYILKIISNIQNYGQSPCFTGTNEDCVKYLEIIGTDDQSLAHVQPI